MKKNASKTPVKSKKRSNLQAEPAAGTKLSYRMLEPRMVFDAALAATTAEAAKQTDAAAPAADTTHATAVATEAHATLVDVLQATPVVTQRDAIWVGIANGIETVTTVERPILPMDTVTSAGTLPAEGMTVGGVVCVMPLLTPDTGLAGSVTAVDRPMLAPDDVSISDRLPLDLANDGSLRPVSAGQGWSVGADTSIDLKLPVQDILTTAIRPISDVSATPDMPVSKPGFITGGGAPTNNSVVFIDSRVANPEIIAQHVAPGSEVVYLNDQTDGLDQIAAYLAGHHDVASIHILSHGTSGDLLLGSTDITNDTLLSHRADLAAIGAALRPGGDILIYGCNVGGGIVGDQLVNTIAKLTGDDVAASIDATGAAARGGNWVLEKTAGTIETVTIAAPEWDGLLTLNVTTGSTAAALAANITNNGSSGLVVIAGSESLTTAGTGATPFAGQFTTTGSNLGIANGVVLGTGDVTKTAATGTQTPANTFWTGAGSASNTGGQFDVANLKFDFKANVGKVVVTYVFGSEEYNEFVNSKFNDAFFIAVTGVNPAGGNYLNTHVSKVPGTALDVAINTVNNGFSNGSTAVTAGTTPTNPAWFRDNVGTAPAVADIVLDGLTKTISNVIRVVAGNTYTINFNIADVGDNGYNSAVFIDNVIASLQLDLDLNRSSGAAGQGYQTTFTEKGAAVSIADLADTKVLNYDTATSIQGAQIVLTNAQAGDVLTFTPSAATGAVVAAIDTSVAGVVKIQLTGTGTTAQYQAAIDAVTFSNATTSGISVVDRNLTVVVSDGETLSNQVTSIIHVNAVNLAPTLAVPVAQTVLEDTTLVFNTANGNALSIGDTDAGAAGLETVTLSVTKGTVTLGSTAGLTGLTGDGTSSATFTGTVAQVNAAIAGLKYQGIANYNGADTLTIKVTDDGKDNGNAAINGALSTTSTVAINVTPVNDAPAGTDKTAAATEDTPYTFVASDFGFTDPNDTPANTLQSVIITTLPLATDGVLTVGGVAVTAGQELTAAQLATLTFTPALNRNGSGIGAFTFQVRDNGGTANGGVDLDASPNTFKFNVAAVNDAPVSAVPVAQTVNEDTVLTFSAAGGNGITISDVDAAATGLETVTISATNGVVTLGSTTGLTGLTGNGTASVTFTGTIAQVNAAVAALKYQGNANFNGSDVISIAVVDDGKDNGVLASNGAQSAVVKTIAVTVTPVNDAPAGTDKTATATEDTPYTFVASDFGFSDVNDTPANTLLSVIITTLPPAADGVLTVGGVAVTAGQELTAAQLATLTFTPVLNRNGSGIWAFTFQVRDNGGTANGGVNLDASPNTFKFNVAAVNDAPVVGSGYSATYTEQGAIVPIATAAGTTISDVDNATLASATITLTNHQTGDVLGMPTLPAGSGITITSYNPATGVLILSGTSSVANYQSAIDSINFYNPTDAPSAIDRTVSIVVNDGVLNSNAAITTIHVTPVNDAPIIALNPAANLLTNGSFEVTTGVTVQNGNNIVGPSWQGWTSPSGNALNIIHPAATPFFDGPDTAADGAQYLDIAGTGSVAQTFTITQAGVYNFGGSFASRDINLTPATFDTLAGHTGTIDIVNSSNVVVATLSQGTLTMTLGDEAWFAVNGSVNLAVGTYTYRMTMGDYVHFDNAYVSANTNTERTFVENGAPISIANPLGSSVTDPDNTTMTSAKIVLTNAQAADTLAFGSLAGLGITGTVDSSVAGKITITLTGTASLANYQTAISAVTFQNTSDLPSPIDRLVTVTVTDGALTSNTAVSTIHVVPVNDAPVSTTPPVQVVLEDSVLTLSTATANAITISDVDAGTTGLETITLSVANGTLNLGSTGGITGLSGNGTSAVTFTGTLAQVNAAIDGLTYRGTANFNGSDVITVKVTDDGKDNGTLASNGALSAVVKTIPITVTPVNDAPVTTVPVAQTVAEDTPLTISGISVFDVDAGAAGQETVTLSVAHGTLNLATMTGLTGLAGNGTNTVTFTGTLADVNAAINGLKYQSDANYNGPDLLTVKVTDDGKDNGNVASNGALSANIQTIAINVTPVNDAPVAVADSYTTNENAILSVPVGTGLLGNDTDVDNAHTALVVTQINGATYTPGQPITLASGAIVTPNGDGTFAYNPNGKYDTLPAGQTASDSFTYQVSDGNGGFATATATIVIVGVNNAPVAINDTYSTGEKTVLNVPVATGLLANDSDVDTAHALLAVVQVNGAAVTSGAPIALPSGAILTQNADGTFGYNPNSAFNSLAAGQTATDTFTYQVSDGKGGVTTASATVTITGVNDAPVAKADTNSTNPRVAITADAAHGVLTNDTDADTAHNLLVVSGVTNGTTSVPAGSAIAGTNGGTFTINTDGSYTFDPGTAFDGLPLGASATTSITYTVSDGQGGFATTTLTVSVPYENLPPFVANPPLAQSSLDGNAVSIALGGVFSDPNPADQTHLTITATGLPPGLAIDASGNITGTLTANASQHSGPYQVTLTATDPYGSQISTTFNFSVSNPAPVAVNDTATVLEHGTTSGNVVMNDHDGGTDTDPLTVTQVNGAAYTAGSVITLASGAQLTMAADGTYNYDPHSAFNGLGVGQTATDTFTYQVSDGNGGFATATATITIQGQNDAPIVIDPAHPGTPPTDPNHIVPAQTGADGTAITPLTVTSFFKDPDSTDTLTLSVTGTLPAGVTFNAATGTFSGTPVSNASQGGPANNGVYTVLVNAADGHGGVVSTSVTFTIGNPAPIAQADSNTVAEHATTTGNVLTNDHDGGGDTDPLTVATVNGATVVPGATIALPSGAHLVMAANGTYTYDPAGVFAALSASQTATDTFTYQVSDGQGGFATATATITIQGQNDNPVAKSDGNTTNPQVAITIDAAHGVLANDTDAEHDPLTVTGVSNGTTSAAAGSAIAGTNGGTFTVQADGSYTFDPGHAFDSLAPGATGQTSITYTISDGHGGTSSTTLTITVPFTNLPPVVQQPIITQTATDGSVVSIPAGGVFADPNPGDVISITATGLPPGLSYDPVSNAIVGTLTADASQHGGMPYTVTLTAKDPSGSTVTSTFTYNVGNVPPVAVADTNTVAEHGTTTGAVLANDHDGGLDTDTLTVAQVNGAAFTPGGTITLASGALLVMNANGTYSYDPNGAFNGLATGQNATDMFTYQVSDGQGGVATATVVITITGQNEAPIVVDPAHPGTPADPNHVVPAQSGQDGTAIVPLNVTSFFADADKADTLTLSVPAGSLPPGVTFNPATGIFSGTPTPAASQGGNAGPGTYDVVVTANDGHGGVISTTVTFKITNPAPVAAADSNTVTEHGSITNAVSVLTNDHDGGSDTDPLAVSQVNGSAAAIGTQIALPSGALLTMKADGTYSYNPNGAFAYLQAGQATTDSFVYQVSDGQGGFATATVTIVINGQNDNPVANVDTNAVVAGSSVSVVAPLGVLANDTDVEHDPLAVTGITATDATTGTVTTAVPGAPITGSNGGTFTINTDGSYTFDTGNAFDSLFPGTQTTTSVTYTIADGHGGMSTTTLTITIPFADLPPVVNAPVPVQTSQDGNPVTIDVSNVFKDPNPTDQGHLVLTADNLPPGLKLVPTTDPLTGKTSYAITGTLLPDASQHVGPYTVILTAKDPANHTITSSFDFTVTNPPPVAVNDVNTVGEHGTITNATVTANDHDGGTDTDPLTVTLVNGQAASVGGQITLPSGALLTMATNGTYAYDTNGKFNGLALGQTASDSFTYQISDGQGGTSTATVAITITGVNEAPLVLDPAHPGVAVVAGQSVIPTQPALDGSPITPLNVTSFFVDPDKTDTLALSVDPSKLPPGVKFDPATGTFSGTPTKDASQGGTANVKDGKYDVVITATDANGLTVTTVVVFQVGNPAPVAAADSASVLEHGTTTGNVLTGDPITHSGADHDGGGDTDPLVVSQINGVAPVIKATTTLPSGAVLVTFDTITLPSGALLDMKDDGTYSYNPNGKFNTLGLGQTATDTFTYQVSDGNGGFATATATITITGQNDLPVVVDPVTGTPPADPMHIVPSQTATDGTAITPLTVTSFFKDPDTGDTLALSVAPGQLPNGVTFDPATGTFSGTPAADASKGGPAGNGTYPVVITATDSHGATVTTIVTFTIANVPPVAVADTATVLEHGTTTANVLTNDHDGGTDTDPLTVTQVNGQPLVSGSTITLPDGTLLTMNANGAYTFNPNGKFNGLAQGQTATETFTYQMSDGNGGFDTATVTITVTGVNDTPIIVDPANPGTPPADPLHIIPSQTGADGTAITPLTVTGFFKDPDAGDTLTLSVPAGSLPPGITFDPDTGTFKGTPTSAASQGGTKGVYPVTVTATDSHGLTVTTIVTFSFTNPPPVATNDLLAVPADKSGTGTVLYNDHDGGSDYDTLTVTQVNGVDLVAGAQIKLPSGALLVMNADGTYSYNPNGLGATLGHGQSTTDTFTYQVSDGNGGFDTATVTITVNAANAPPVVVDPAHPGTPPADPLHIVPAQTGLDGAAITPLSVASYFTDPNSGDVISFAVPAGSLPAGVLFDPVTGTFSGTPTAAASQGGPAHNGIYPITVTASDPYGGSTTTIVTFTIGNVPPVAADDTLSVPVHGTVATGNVITNDHDGGADTDPLAVTLVNGAAFTPGVAVTLPSGALLTMNTDGTYSYDPNGTHPGLGFGQTATDTFTYQISDGNGGLANATVAITVTGVNDAPVVVDQAHPGTPPADPLHVIPTAAGNDGTAITPISVATYFKDPNTIDTLTLSVNPATLPPGISFDPATGTFSGTPATDASKGGPAGTGTYPVVITADDGHGGTVTTIITFTIANVPPVAVADTASVLEHGTTTGAVLANDHDGGSDTDPLVVSQVNGVALVAGSTITLPSGALLVMAADGTYSYNPNGKFSTLGLGQTATDTFTYQVSDGNGGLATAIATITINGQNDLPVVVDPATGKPPADPMHIVPSQTATDGTAITPLTVTSFFKDPDTGDTLKLSVPAGSLPPGVKFDPNTNTFSGTPTAAASQGGPAGNGTYPVVITATDSHGATVTTIVTFTIANVPPVAVADTATVLEHGTTTANVLTNDHDGGTDTDPLKVTQVNGSAVGVGHEITLPSGAKLTLNADGTYVYNPNGVFQSLSVGEIGTDTFTYQVSDGNGGVATATVVISITGENDAPVVVDPVHPGTPPADPLHVLPVITGNDGSPIAPLSVASVFHDPDNHDTLTYGVATGSLPPGLSFDPATGTFTGIPTSDASQGGPGHNGTYPVVVTASDGHGGTVSTIVTFTFANVPPVATNDTGRTDPGSTVTLDVLANDHDGGSDHDPLTIVSATSPAGAVAINTNGSLAFTPNDGFAGVATITYTISDGQGGFSTATARILVTPNIHDAGPTAPAIASPGNNAPGNSGIIAPGAVLDAVHDAGSLGGTATGLASGITAAGIVDAAANQISGLNGSGIAGHIDPRDTGPVWRLQNLITERFAAQADSWSPEGLTGFSLRYTFAADPLSSARGQIILDSMVRDRQLIVNLSHTDIAGHAKVVEYRVMQADGRPLPAWLNNSGQNVLIGEHPVDVEVIKLRVIAVMSDGTTLERDVVIQTNSGEIQPLKETKRADATPLFSEQLTTFAERDQTEFERLLKALAG